jgi:hypothetical protein
MYAQTLVRTLILTALVLTLSWPLSALAKSDQPKWDLPPRLVDEPQGIAQLREKYQGMTEEELSAAGFRVEPVCVGAGMVGLSAEDGGMGYHDVNGKLYAAQFPNGTMDANNPPIVLLGPDKRVVGVEWEAKNLGQGPPIVYGQTVNLGPPHPGADKPHYMLHAYFRPNGKVLFGDFDPQVNCPAMPNAGGGGMARQRDMNPMLPVAALAIVALAGGAWVVRGRA